MVFLVAGCKKETADADPETPDPEVTDPDDSHTFTNPLLPRGADPWVTRHDGTYYYIINLTDKQGDTQNIKGWLFIRK